MEGKGCVLPESLNFAPMRQKGRHEAGYRHLAGMQTTNPAGTSAFQVTGDTFMEAEETEGNLDGDVNQIPPKRKDLVSILCSKNSRRTHNFADIITNSKPVKLLEANGSVRSIIDWAKKARLDRQQRRAFEILAATFVLSFYNDAEDELDELGEHGQNSKFKHEQRQLKQLVEERKRQSEQLVCLLHGPGGRGKTAVIDLVLAYSKEYCSFMKDYELISRTIVVTAMTGVAATLLLGETTHSALYLNQKKSIEAEQVFVWKETRLLIIDEISFASKEDFVLIHQRLQILKQKLHAAYGGIHIVFAGTFASWIQLEKTRNQYTRTTVQNSRSGLTSLLS